MHHAPAARWGDGGAMEGVLFYGLECQMLAMGESGDIVIPHRRKKRAKGFSSLKLVEMGNQFFSGNIESHGTREGNRRPR